MLASRLTIFASLMVILAGSGPAWAQSDLLDVMLTADFLTYCNADANRVDLSGDCESQISKVGTYEYILGNSCGSGVESGAYKAHTLKILGWVGAHREFATEPTYTAIAAAYRSLFPIPCKKAR